MNYRSDELTKGSARGSEVSWISQPNHPFEEVKSSDYLDQKSPQNRDCSRRQFGRILNYDHSGRIFMLPALAASDAEFVR